MAKALVTACIVFVCLVAAFANPGIGLFVLLIGALAAWSAVRGTWERAARARRKARKRDPLS